MKYLKLILIVFLYLFLQIKPVFSCSTMAKHSSAKANMYTTKINLEKYYKKNNKYPEHYSLIKDRKEFRNPWTAEIVKVKTVKLSKKDLNQKLFIKKTYLIGDVLYNPVIKNKKIIGYKVYGVGKYRGGYNFPNLLYFPHFVFELLFLTCTNYRSKFINLKYTENFILDGRKNKKVYYLENNY